MINDTELENTLKNLKNNTRFFKTREDQEHGWMSNGYPVEILRGTEVEINDEKFNITPGVHKVLVDTSYKTNKSMNDLDKVVFRDMLQKSEHYNPIPTKDRRSSRDKNIKITLDYDV